MQARQTNGFIHGGNSSAVEARIEREVRAEFEARLRDAGWFRRMWIERRIQAEIAKRLGALQFIRGSCE